MHAKNAASAGSGKPKKPRADSWIVYEALTRLCQTQEALTEQISRLAQSNEDLIQAMASEAEQESEGPDLRHL